eukprot:3544402-Rhodomonas_salina.1
MPRGTARAQCLDSDKHDADARRSLSAAHRGRTGSLTLPHSGSGWQEARAGAGPPRASGSESGSTGVSSSGLTAGTAPPSTSSCHPHRTRAPGVRAAWPRRALSECQWVTRRDTSPRSTGTGFLATCDCHRRRAFASG